MAPESSIAGSSRDHRLSDQKPAALERRLADGRRLMRPATIEEEIRNALQSDEWALARRAAVDDAAAPDYLSSECLVHLARRDLRGPRRWVESFVPALLRRCERNLRRTVRGLAPLVLEEIREEILGQVVETLLDPGDGADFFEVRFDLALKRLRIDTYRRLYRRRAPEVALDEEHPKTSGGFALLDLGSSRAPNPKLLESLTTGSSFSPNPSLSPEQRVALSQALARLEDRERQAVVLHHLLGVPVSSGRHGQTTVAQLLGVSERTVRNLLQRAKQRWAAEPGSSP